MWVERRLCSRAMPRHAAMLCVVLCRGVRVSRSRIYRRNIDIASRISLARARAPRVSRLSLIDILGIVPPPDACELREPGRCKEPTHTPHATNGVILVTKCLKVKPVKLPHCTPTHHRARWIATTHHHLASTISSRARGFCGWSLADGPNWAPLARLRAARE